jgi:hypothetical protein
MHDNKLRLSPDVIAKAEEIAETWGLKNSRAAVEAVFRKYADDYQYGRQPMMAMLQGLPLADGSGMMSPIPIAMGHERSPIVDHPGSATETSCAALSELDDLLGI